MKLYEIVATHRSGHHSMMNWIIVNITGLQSTWDYKMNILNDSGLYQLNCANHDIPDAINLYNEFKKGYKELIVSYEDTNWDYTIFNQQKKYRGKLSLNLGIEGNLDYKRIVFIRDFYSNLFSRLKSNENQNFKTYDEHKTFQFDVGRDFIWRWKNNARACLENKTHFLKFEDWLTNDEVRKSFLKEVTGLNEFFGTKNIIGTHSSFGDVKGVLNREYDIPENVKEVIRKDTELHYLIGRLGYEYREI
jgi:hypothetical protein